jgi:CRP-like cAMP-binding protein
VTQVSSAFTADPELIQELERRSTPVPLPPDRVLFHHGEPPSGVYILSKGLALLTGNGSDPFPVIVKAGPGALLGLPAVIGSKPYTLTAQVTQGAEVRLVSSEEFVDLMQSQPSLAFRVLQILASEVRFARETVYHA